MNPKIQQTSFGVYVMKDDTHLSRWVEADGRLDHARHQLGKLKYLVPEGGTVVDCGTSIGDHTVTYASWVGPTGKVLGFEANPDVAECCALNLKIYPWATIHNVGLAESAGYADIQLDANVGASHLVEGKGIKLDKLDSFIEQMNGRCDFIKVDIEGYEPKMIAGAIETIRKFKPAIMMEINKGALERQGYNSDIIFRQFRQLEYDWTVIDGQYSSLQYDILAKPRRFAKKST